MGNSARPEQAQALAFRRLDPLDQVISHLDRPGPIEQGPDSWDLVLPVTAAGARLLLTLAAGAVLEGRLVEVRPDAVVMEDNRVRQGRFSSPTPLREALTFARADVTLVSRVHPPTNYTAFDK